MTRDKERLDVLLVERGLAETREKARRIILAGRIIIRGIANPKPGIKVPADADISLKSPPEPYVGRGGVKLAAALERFHVDPSGLVCLDVGASTGGFTDCLLQKGAARVYAVDVGYGQMHEKIRSDPRVIVRERVNARFIGQDIIPEPVHLCVMDVSFISILLILPALIPLLAKDGAVVTLVKPQFEAGRSQVPRGGVIRDVKVHSVVLETLVSALTGKGWTVQGLMPSPIKGASGNREFFAFLKRADAQDIEASRIQIADVIREFVEPAP